jgi:hypothetical protein
MTVNKLRKTKKPSGGIWTSIFNGAEKAHKTVKKVRKLSVFPKDDGPSGYVPKKRKTTKRSTTRKAK